MGHYAKFVAQILATIGVAIVAALADNSITNQEWVNVSIAGLGALAVLGAGNLPATVWEYTKGWVAAATAGAVYLASAITEGGIVALTASQWIQFGLACLGAVGVVAIRNSDGTQRVRHA